MFVLTNERNQNISDRILILSSRGFGGAEGGQNNFFFKHGHVAYQIEGDDELNRMQMKYSS